MTRKHHLMPAIDTPNFSPRLYGIALVVSAIVIAGIFGISRFVALDFARDLQTWQEKLNIIAESRNEDIARFVGGNMKELRSLADNPSLQIYLAETTEEKNKDKSGDVESGQKAYLRNLLLFTAERAGFSAPGSLPSIHANIPQDHKGGLVVLNNRNEMVVSSSMTPAMRDFILEQLKKIPPSGDSLIDIQRDKDGVLMIGFAVSVYAVQAEQNPESQIGRVVGIKVIDDGFFNLLKHPGNTDRTLETMLVRTAGERSEKVEYLSPLLDESGPLTKVMDKDGGKFAVEGLIDNIGSFEHDKLDYRDKKVLATSRSVSGTPWTLVAKIDRDEALAQSSERRSSMVIFFFLIIAIIVLIIVAVWWHAHSLRSMMMSHHFRRMANRARAQEQLLRLVADHQPEPIYIVDRNLQYQFANQKAAASSGMTEESIIGKSLVDVRGAARAAMIGKQCETARDSLQITYDETHVMEGKQERIIRSAYVPLDHIPVTTLPENTPGVLVVEQDISDVVHERERRLSTHHQLVQTLLRLVDKRDPFAANHSLLVSQLSHEVAIQMELDNVTVETTRFAASLMNIGKIVVPPELLTKTEALTGDEKRIIHDSMNLAAELMREVRFDGPVSDTLRQWQEKWDGSGPMALKGEEILVSARIIAAANAFIGMISPRSWRNAIPMESANKFLLDQCDTLFDRRVVVALINYVENHNGRAWINQLLEEKKRAA